MQAAPVYLTLWYKREQLALRIGILFSVAAIAGSFNGLISYGIYIDINGVHGWPAWKWLFFVQGKSTITLRRASRRLTGPKKALLL